MYSVSSCEHDAVLRYALLIFYLILTILFQAGGRKRGSSMHAPRGGLFPRCPKAGVETDIYIRGLAQNLRGGFRGHAKFTAAICTILFSSHFIIKCLKICTSCRENTIVAEEKNHPVEPTSCFISNCHTTNVEVVERKD